MHQLHREDQRSGRAGKNVIPSISETQRGEAFEIFTLLLCEGRFIALRIRASVIGASIV
jgi:hypothetical protein